MTRQVRGAGKRISSGIRPHQPASSKIVAPRRCKVAFDPVVPDGSAHPIVVDVQIPHAQEFQDRTTSADYSAVTEASIIHDTSVTGIPVQFLRVAPCCNTEPLSRTDFPYLLMRVRYSGSVWHQGGYQLARTTFGLGRRQPRPNGHPWTSVARPAAMKNLGRYGRALGISLVDPDHMQAANSW